MNIQKHTQSKQLERYSFWWSEARLFVAAVALLIGGRPPILVLNPIPALYGTFSSLLTLAWIMSGIASIYMFYRWRNNDRTLFGHRLSLDKTAFFVSIISGLNLGLTGLFGINIGISISYNYGILLVVAILYLVSAGYLWSRWKTYGNKMF